MIVRALLFDLDGTLVDTAPDLIAALNHMLREEGRPRVPYAIARSEASNGAVGLLRLAYGEPHAEREQAELRRRFILRYRKNVCLKSNLFHGIQTILDMLYELGIPWGIVTNKPHAMTEPLLSRLGLTERAACVISGDRLPQKKPHPAPLLLAADQLAVAPAECVYVGDAPRDIDAGRAAGMRTVAAAYGYLSPAVDPAAWGPDLVIRRPAELADALGWLQRQPTPAGAAHGVETNHTRTRASKARPREQAGVATPLTARRETPE